MIVFSKNDPENTQFYLLNPPFDLFNANAYLSKITCYTKKLVFYFKGYFCQNNLLIFFSGTPYTKCLTYYMPTTDGMVKMMDIAR